MDVNVNVDVKDRTVTESVSVLCAQSPDNGHTLNSEVAFEQVLVCVCRWANAGATGLGFN